MDLSHCGIPSTVSTFVEHSGTFAFAIYITVLDKLLQSAETSARYKNQLIEGTMDDAFLKMKSILSTYYFVQFPTHIVIKELQI